MGDVIIYSMKNIEIKQHYSLDRFDLYVNGYKLGEYIHGKQKFYEKPESWAAKQIKKRNIVIDRNIRRLNTELVKWTTEKRAINK